jgi:hypothetical protein
MTLSAPGSVLPSVLWPFCSASQRECCLLMAIVVDEPERPIDNWQPFKSLNHKLG